MRRLPLLLTTCFLTAHPLAAQAPPEALEVTFVAASDGTAQRYLLLLPQPFDDRQQHDVLIALHGQGSDRHQFMQPTRGETQAALSVASSHHLIYVSPDYRAPANWMGPLAEADLDQIIADLRAQYRVRKLILCGASMGGTGTLTYAVLHPDQVDGAVAMNPSANLLQYDHYQEAIAASFRGPKDRIPEEYKRRSAEYWPERLAMPLAITTGGQDTTVPPDSALRLAATLLKLKRNVLLIHRPDGGHETGFADALAALEYVLAVAGVTGNPGMHH
jgi:pimeloyl-ACP methyl ester carboxylesterase